MQLVQKVGFLFALPVLLGGCATVDQKAGFSEISAAIKEQNGMSVIWNRGTDLDADASDRIRSLLADELTVDEAVQVALLNNRDLQAIYSELGVAQADLVQAGLLRNPVFDGIVTFPAAGGPAELELGTALDFLGIFYLPLRKRVAAARFEVAKLGVKGAVLDFAAGVRTAFYRHQADEQVLEMRRTIFQALTASMEVAQRLHEAGNITDLALARERALAEEAKLQLGSAELAVRQSREQLNTGMGLWGEGTAWKIDERLPDIPKKPMEIEALESQAIRRSVDLSRAKQQIIVAGEELGLNRTTSLIPELHLGGIGKREGAEKEWQAGPSFELAIPLFDQGQARIGRARAELRRAKQEYYALAVRIRSTVRAVRDRLRGARDRALYYRDILLPLRERIVNESQLQYNAMQLGPIELLRARERQVEAAASYVEALHGYWMARTEVRQILSGRLPSLGAFQMRNVDRKSGVRKGNGH